MMRFLGKTLAVAAACGAMIAIANAQTPKRGGVVVQGYESGDPATYDCHGAVSSLLAVSPHYSLLLRYDLAHYPKIEGDAAESWSISSDGLTYTFKIRPNVKFHDGTPLTAADVKASFDRMKDPPQGVVSWRKTEFTDVASITVVDPLTISFKLSQPNTAMLDTFASPYNCIYSARRLADNPTFPATNIMGSGPFVFSEHVKGSHWEGKRFDAYFRPGQPYLDGFRTAFIAAGSGPLAVAGGQIDMLVRTLQPQEIETLKTRMGDNVRFYTTPILIQLITVANSSRKPFDDVRVRRALNLAIDRVGGLGPMSKVTNMEVAGGFILPGGPYALPPDELAKQPGFNPDIEAARAEARRLLAEAGQSDLKFTLLSRTTPSYNLIGVYAIDQWRRIGVTVENNPIDAAPYNTALAGGQFDVAVDVNTITAEDPSVVLNKYVPGGGANFGRYTDATLTQLFEQQKKLPDPAARKKVVADFEKRLFSEAYVQPFYWAGWTSVTRSNVHGWTPTPVYSAGYDMGAIWKD